MFQDVKAVLYLVDIATCSSAATILDAHGVMVGETVD